LVPSAKALGKRKAVNSPLQAMQLRPDAQSSSPSSRPSVVKVESTPTFPTATADNNFDCYINYSPSSPFRSAMPTSDNPSSHLGAGDPYAYPNPYSNFTLSNINFVDHRGHHRQPSPSFSIAEPPPTSLLYHSDDYGGTPDNYSTSLLVDPPQSGMNYLPPTYQSIVIRWRTAWDVRA
jgi:hypothetical protein